MNKPRIGNIRAYLAGTGATGALIAGAVVAFLTVAALVAFNGFPLGGDDADGSVSLAEQPGGLAPESAAAALGAAPGAVAATPAGGAVLAAVLPGASGPGEGGGPGGGPGDGGPGPGPGSGPGPGPGPTPPSDDGIVTDLVGDLDDTTSGVGLPGIGGTTRPITEAIDRTLNDTLNNVGGALGQPRLGNQVDDTVRGLSGGLLGD